MERRHINNLKRFADEVRISVGQTQPPPAPNKSMMDALVVIPTIAVIPAEAGIHNGQRIPKLE